MLLFVGLGNPGPEYAKNRHNIGFMVLDEIADRKNFSSWTLKSNAFVAEGRIGSEKVMALKPQTFMNNSGNAVGPIAKFYKLAPEQIYVFYDELDVAPAKLKIKQGGGNGGHNGLKSIDRRIANPYWRIRMGIGHPGDKSRVNGHVLGNFAKTDADWLDQLLVEMAREIDYLVEEDKNRFVTNVMQTFAKASPRKRGSP